MKLGKKQRIQILERAYDKTAKLLPGIVETLTELERFYLDDAIRYSAKLAKKQRKAYRDNVWEHFGWDTAESMATYEKMIQEVCYGQRV